MESKQEIRLLVVLSELLSSHKKTSKSISLGEIFDKLESQGLIFLLALISLPMAFPIPTPPGLTTIFGIPMCIISFQLVWGNEKPWLPNWLRKKQIKISSFESFVDRLTPYFIKFTKFLHKRRPHLQSGLMAKIAYVVAFACSVSVALPILFGNAVPCAAVLIISVSFIYKDGLFTLIGIFAGIIGLTIASVSVFITLFYGYKAIELAKYSFF